MVNSLIDICFGAWSPSVAAYGFTTSRHAGRIAAIAIGALADRSMRRGDGYFSLLRACQRESFFATTIALTKVFIGVA